jgi:hypothetical protein
LRLQNDPLPFRQCGCPGREFGLGDVAALEDLGPLALQDWLDVLGRLSGAVGTQLIEYPLPVARRWCMA